MATPELRAQTFAVVCTHPRSMKKSQNPTGLQQFWTCFQKYFFWKFSDVCAKKVSSSDMHCDCVHMVQGSSLVSEKQNMPYIFTHCPICLGLS